MYWAVGVSVTARRSWCVCSACLHVVQRLVDLRASAVGWIWLVMKARLVVPTWSPNT